MGGVTGLRSANPLTLHDHAIQQHNAWVTRPMLARTGLAAGYDPFFMAGYAKSLFSSPSSTLFEVAALATGGVAPTVVYKAVVFLSIAALPLLVAFACLILGLRGVTSLAAVSMFLLYLWTDGAGGGYPMAYASIGMTAYLLCVPLGLVVTAAIVRFLAEGGRLRWCGAAILAALVFLVHVTSVLFLAPAALAACLAVAPGTKRRGSRIFAVLWFLPLAAIALNAFWILPASWLRNTRSPGAAFLVNSDVSDPVLGRLARIVWKETPSQAFSLALGLIGLAALSRRDRVAATALGAFAAAGFALGYLAGFTHALDFLQPGRQTHALYSAASVLAGIGLAEIGGRVRSIGSRRLNIAALVALVLIGVRVFGMNVEDSVRNRLGLRVDHPSLPYLTSEPRPHFTEILDSVRAITKPGDRVFYEEYGITVDKNEPDPFAGGRYSGLLPQLLGVEVIGGPYLHVGVKTNFTQIGEGKLFGRTGWDRDRFLAYAKLYRPSAIVCFSAGARTFCLRNPDLVHVSYHREGLFVGQVVGFAGPAIRGQAEVAAEQGRLRVTGLVPDDLDGLVVLRYHVVAGLRCRPEMPIVPILLEDDPVPFLGLRPAAGQTQTLLDIGFPPGR